MANAVKFVDPGLNIKFGVAIATSREQHTITYRRLDLFVHPDYPPGGDFMPELVLDCRSTTAGSLVTLSEDVEVETILLLHANTFIDDHVPFLCGINDVYVIFNKKVDLAEISDSGNGQEGEVEVVDDDATGLAYAMVPLGNDKCRIGCITISQMKHKADRRPFVDAYLADAVASDMNRGVGAIVASHQTSYYFARVHVHNQVQHALQKKKHKGCCKSLFQVKNIPFSHVDFELLLDQLQRRNQGGGDNVVITTVDGNGESTNEGRNINNINNNNSNSNNNCVYTAADCVRSTCRMLLLSASNPLISNNMPNPYIQIQLLNPQSINHIFGRYWSSSLLVRTVHGADAAIHCAVGSTRVLYFCPDQQVALRYYLLQKTLSISGKISHTNDVTTFNNNIKPTLCA